MTERQEQYCKYLRTDHWKRLRESAVKRDGSTCVACGATSALQVHHVRYRSKWEDSILDDVETLCRKCHRLTHGYGFTEFELQCEVVERNFGYSRRPAKPEWRKLVDSMSGCGFELECFGELMFQYVLNVIAHERETSKEWWMDATKHDFWYRRAFNVRKSIQERSG